MGETFRRCTNRGVLGAGGDGVVVEGVPLDVQDVASVARHPRVVGVHFPRLMGKRRPGVNPSYSHSANSRYCVDVCRRSSRLLETPELFDCNVAQPETSEGPVDKHFNRCLTKLITSKMCQNQTGNCEKSECVKLFQKNSHNSRNFWFNFEKTQEKSPLSDLTEGNGHIP